MGAGVKLGMFYPKGFMHPPGTPKRVLFVDIDSTVRHGFRELGRLVTTAEDVVIYPAALAQLKKAVADGWRVVGITNQGRVALGELTYTQMWENLVETQHKCKGTFDRIVACIHHPDATDPEMANCWCRKPRIGSIVEAVLDLGKQYKEYYPPHRCLFVGNQIVDQQCAENAGIPFMWASEWRGEEPIEP